MGNFGVRSSLADKMVSRSGARWSLGIAALMFIILFGVFGQAEPPAGSAQAPTDSESAEVSRILAKFPNADQQSVLLVATRADSAALTQTDIQALGDLATSIGFTPDGTDSDGVASNGAAPDGTATTTIPSGPIISDDGVAAMIVMPIQTGDTNGDTAGLINELRHQVASNAPEDLSIHVTGGPAFAADIASAFDGADFTLLFVTIAIVAILLIGTYRSPVLWLLPLTIVGLADQIAAQVTAALGQALALQFDAGIISVLVFGAGTNYALLLISRYREELHTHTDHRQALAAAWRNCAPAIVASNVTVVLALLTLGLAVIPGTRGLGISAAVGLVIAVVAVLFVLPPLLAVSGRKAFWPFIPRPGDSKRTGGMWHKIATVVMNRPALSLVAGLGLLAVMVAGLAGTSVGLDQMNKFRGQSPSAVGLEVLSDHFPAGESQPIYVVAATDHAPDVVTAATAVEGVVRAHQVSTTPDGGWTKIMVTGQHAPGTASSLAQIEDLREAVHAVPGAQALVGGAVATDFDARAGNERDLATIAPLVLVVSLLVLVLLLRSLLAPILLLVINGTSALAAIGAGAWLSRVVFDQPALDAQVPLLAFIFLVGLGIDYTIFLVHRARDEARGHGTRNGMVRAISHTGSVITSAGIVLAGVFAALGVLPLVVLGQLGLIVGVGILVDTTVVRTVIVPSLFGLIGERIWWPGHGPAMTAHTASAERSVAANV